jgi:hypothetical protein
VLVFVVALEMVAAFKLAGTHRTDEHLLARALVPLVTSERLLGFVRLKTNVTLKPYKRKRFHATVNELRGTGPNKNRL